jgi:hypothetical protein
MSEAIEILTMQNAQREREEVRQRRVKEAEKKLYDAMSLLERSDPLGVAEEDLHNAVRIAWLIARRQTEGKW